MLDKNLFNKKDFNSFKTTYDHITSDHTTTAYSGAVGTAGTQGTPDTSAGDVYTSGPAGALAPPVSVGAAGPPAVAVDDAYIGLSSAVDLVSASAAAHPPSPHHHASSAAPLHQSSPSAVSSSASSHNTALIHEAHCLQSL